MISKVTIQNFKRFKAPTVFVLKPEGMTFLAGGNNSGKSTLLQALAVWEFARSVVGELRKDIPGLKVISLEDRDDYPFAETKPDLTYGSMKSFYSDLGLRRWRRRNIENYLLHPAAIARAARKKEEEVSSFSKRSTA